MASIKEVAKRAGVSIATVSRYMNKSAYVDTEKAAAIQEAIDYYHYQPSQFGRGLVKQKSNLVGVYFYLPGASTFEGTYNLELLKGLEEGLAGSDYSIVILHEDKEIGHNTDALPKYLGYIRQQKIDGLIISGLTGDMMHQREFENVLSEGFPTVYIGKKFHQYGMNVYAQFENYSYQMIKTLYQNGHRKVMFLYSDMHAHYVKSIEERTAQELPDLCLEMYRVDGYQMSPVVLRRALEEAQQWEITAICSSAMDVTRMLISAADEKNIRIPEDISIISVEHSTKEHLGILPAISSYYVPAYDMGKTAAKLLLQAMENQDQPSVITREFEIGYIARDSVKYIVPKTDSQQE